MKKIFIAVSVTLGLTVLFSLTARTAKATTINASDNTSLVAAITAAGNGDIINITQDITVSAEIDIIGKALTINGNGYTVSVPVPGLDASGIFNTSPSTFRLLVISANGKTVSINNLALKGGKSASQGAAIYNGVGTTLKLTGVTISNSRCDAGGGGLDNDGGTVYLKDSNISRNAADHGGGFLNINTGGKMFIENSTFSENRSTSSGGGGGAGENQAALYINNSTFSNNKSTELGGAINNYGGTMYAINTTFTGNVAYGSFAGGAIANHDSGTAGNVTVINSLFTYNYKNTGTSDAPVYALSDIYKYSGAKANAFYDIFQSPDSVSVNADLSNITYTGTASGTDNSIFTGGANTQILAPDGTVLGTNTVFQPYLVKTSSTGTPTALLKAGSFALATGTPTGFTNGNGTPTVGYYNGSTWVTLVGSGANGYQVTADQNYNSRAVTQAVGAVVTTASDIYMLKVNSAANGTVNGATVYGDVYPSGSNVTLTAIASSTYAFASWDYVLGGSGTASTANPYTITITQDTTLIPVFGAASGYTVTYIGNGNTGGSPPAVQAAGANATTTISNQGTLVKTGYSFSNWNTNANGSGSIYNPGDTYSSSNTNLTLYAQYQVSSSDTQPAPANTSNGGFVYYSVTLAKSGGGGITSPNPSFNGTSLNCGSACSASFISGQALTLTASPNPGFVFASWSGDCGNSTSTVCDLTITGNKNISAVFNLITSSGSGDSGNTYLPNPTASSTVLSSTPIPTIAPTSISSSTPTSASVDGFRGLAMPATDSPSLNYLGIPLLTNNLKAGSRGTQVIILQNILKSLGFFPPSVQSSGFFSSITLRAVESFQVQYGIASSGTLGYGQVGPKTRKILNQPNH